MQRGLLFRVLLGIMWVTTFISAQQFVPLPQEVEFINISIEAGDKLGFGSILSKYEKLNIGREAIESRFVELSRESKLRKLPSVRFTVNIGVAGSIPLPAEMRLQISPDNPGPQGYVIQFYPKENPNSVYLIGSDEQGGLYACMTFCQMMRNDGEQVVIDAANVRDWPDFRNRIVGNLEPLPDNILFAETEMECAEQLKDFREYAIDHIDFCLRYKINWIPLRRELNKADNAYYLYGPVARKLLREITDYGHKRGIKFDISTYAAVDVGQGGPASEIRDLWDTHGVRYSWSHDDLIRAHARELGKLAKETGMDLYYLHLPDNTRQGENLGGWGSRSAECRIRWADNQRAEADAHVISIFREEIKKAKPDVVICAVFVPYTTSPEIIEKEKEYLEKTNLLVPPDVAICVRESSREEHAKFRDVRSNHPLYYYIGYHSPASKGYAPLVNLGFHAAGSWDFNDPRDYYYMAHWIPEFQDLACAMAAHFTWNTGAPGAAPFKVGTYDYQPMDVDLCESQPWAGKLIKTILDQFFGPEVGTAVTRAVRANLCWEYVEHDFANIDGLKRNGASAREVIGALMPFTYKDYLDRLWFNTWQRRNLARVVSYIVSTETLAQARAASFETQRLICQERYQQAAEIADDASTRITTDIIQLNKLASKIGGWKNWFVWARDITDQLKQVNNDLKYFRLLADIIPNGNTIEMTELSDNATDSVHLVNSKDLQLINGNIKNSSNALISKLPGRIPGQLAFEFTKLHTKLFFERVDIERYINMNGYLRFYINNLSPEASNRCQVALLFNNTETPKKNKVLLHTLKSFDKKRLQTFHRRYFSVALPGVDIDRLPETWQLVSIPLKTLVPESAKGVIGLCIEPVIMYLPEGKGQTLFVSDVYVIAGISRLKMTERPINYK